MPLPVENAGISADFAGKEWLTIEGRLSTLAFTTVAFPPYVQPYDEENNG
jgi:hypothetical protein